MEKTEYKFRMKDSIIGLQFLFVAFGALVLVPILTGLDPSVALFTAGIGTLAFQFINRKAVPPIFLASSFAFIAPISYGVATWGIAATMSGLIAAGFFYIILSFIIRFKGSDIIHKSSSCCCCWSCYYLYWTYFSTSSCEYGYGKNRRWCNTTCIN